MKSTKALEVTEALLFAAGRNIVHRALAELENRADDAERFRAEELRLVMLASEMDPLRAAVGWQYYERCAAEPPKKPKPPTIDIQIREVIGARAVINIAVHGNPDPDSPLQRLLKLILDALTTDPSVSAEIQEAEKGAQ